MVPRSAWTASVLTLCFDSRSLARDSVFDWDEEEVYPRTRLAPYEASLVAIASPIPATNRQFKIILGDDFREG
jgi:hypothetical protein